MLNWLIQHSPLFYFTQSLWRDEAFSILVAERPLATMLGKLTFEPPVYYTLLHYWIKIFGNSEISTRGLSLVGFMLATIVVIYWAEKLFKKHWLSWFLPLLFFVNPLLLYYAFEVRTYGWYTFFAVLSMYAYLEKKYVLYVLATTLGFYTHAYMLVVPFVQALHFLLTHVKRRNKEFTMHTLALSIQKIIRQPMIRSFLAVAVLIAPWLLRVAKESSKLKDSWYFPVNLHLIKSVLGNMYLGYEGTPWYGWQYTRYLSFVLLALFVFALHQKKTRTRNVFFFLMVFVPLTVVIGISFAKPLFVNRYLLPVSIAQVFLLVFALEAMKKPWLAKCIGATLLVFTVGFNMWYPTKHPKMDIRSMVYEVNSMLGKQDLIFADSPLIFFETIYYSRDRSKVFLYNPAGSPFPWYVGDIVVSPSQMARSFPTYPARAFLIHEDNTYDILYQAPITSAFKKL